MGNRFGKKIILTKLTKVDNFNLFIAEDDCEDRGFITDIFLSIAPGLRISVAEYGAQFMELLKDTTELPNLIILDLNMPIKNGFECLREIKESDKWKNIKTVILSTSNETEQMKRVYAMGANLYLVKPTSYAALKESLIRCLEMDWDTLKQ